MISPVDVLPQGMNGSGGSTVRLDPREGSVLKHEDGALVWRQALPDGTPAVIKIYFNRKMLWLKKTRLYTGRAEREFQVLHAAKSHNVHCSPPLFWAVGKTDCGRSYELLATREVPNALDLKTWITTADNRASLDLAPLFALIARMHRAGIMHGALFARNILIADNRYLLIDFPRSQQFGRSIEGHAAGIFDIRLLLANLSRVTTTDQLVHGCSSYPRLPMPAAELVREVIRHPIRKYRRILLRDIFLLQSVWCRYVKAS